MRLVSGIVVAVISLLGVSVMAQDSAPVTPAEKVSVTTTAVPDELRQYNVSVSIKGSMPSPETGQRVDLDTALNLKIAHKYGRREGDGLLPMEITLTEGSVTMGGQKLTIAPSIYPKLTILLDPKFKINDIFGISGNSYSSALPGINYGNMIILFYLPDGDTPHAVGDKWESKVALPGIGEAYNIVNTLKSVGAVDDAKVATVHQDITRVQKPGESKPTLKASADSVFAVATGKLIKSHLDCDVLYSQPATVVATGKNATPAKQEPQKLSANIKMDITLAK